MNKDLSLDGLPRKTVVEVRDQLIKIKGIRYCTIGVYLMFSSQNPAILPIGDVAVQTTIKELFGIHNKEEMILYTEKWSPYRSYATFLLWQRYLQKRYRKISYNFLKNSNT